jgi:hydrogenase maturation protease
MVESAKNDRTLPKVTIMGVGNTLFSDEGFGVRTLELMEARYRFPKNVSLVDGGVLGVNLLGYISGAENLIVIDCIRNQGTPGDLYRLRGDAIPERIRAKNSLHQIDFLEALTLSQALGDAPETVIVGVEPKDIETVGIELTDVTRQRMDDVVCMVLEELDRIGVTYECRPEGECTPRDCMRFDA